MRTDDSAPGIPSGRSLRSREEMALLQRYADHDDPLLIVGAPGTDWTAAARALDYQGPRQGRAFIPVDCAALPGPPLAELAELVRMAAGGTLFLNHVHALAHDRGSAWPRLLQDACAAGNAAGVRVVAVTAADRPTPDLPGVVRVDHVPARARDAAALPLPLPACGLA